MVMVEYHDFFSFSDDQIQYPKKINSKIYQI